MDLQKYWSDVRNVAAGLPKQPVYYLVSIENTDKNITGGRVMDIPTAKQAAELMVSRTHVLASPADIERFHADLQRQSDELAEAEYKRKQQFGMPKELGDLIRLATDQRRAELAREEAPPPAAPAPTTTKREKG
jgi:hypothetical protein